MRLFCHMKGNLYNIIYIEHKYRTLHGGFYQLIKKTRQAKKEKQTFFERLY